MSNLGAYQIMTTMAKKVGGPLNLGVLFLGGGAALGAGGVIISDSLKREAKKMKEKRNAAVIYTVKKDGASNEGLQFKTGDEFHILEVDGDAALIKLIGNDNNPYFVSVSFLKSISNY